MEKYGSKSLYGTMKISRRQKGALFGLGIPLLLILYILFLFDWNLIKGFAESRASSSTGRTIKINGDLDVDFGWDFAPLIKLKNVSITNMATGSKPLMAKADKIYFEFNLLSIFSDRMDIPYLRLENGDILLEKDKQGNANWLFGATDDKDSEAPKFGRLLVKDSKLTYIDPTENTDLTVVANSDRDFRKFVEGMQNNHPEDFFNLKGEGKYKGNEFGVDYIGASVLDIATRSTPYPLKTSIKIGTTEINVEGTVTDPYALKGIDITLNIKGANAADIFPIFGIALLPTPPYDVTGKLDFADNKWRFTDFKGHMGSSDIRGSLTWDKTKERPFLDAKFISNQLNFADLGAFIGGAPSKAESAQQKQKKAKQAQSPYVIPDTPLDISRLSAMDAHIEFTGTKVVSESLPLDDFYMNVKLDNSVLKLQPIKFGTANGDISADMEVNGRVKPVQISGDFQFKRLSLARMLAPLSKKLSDKNYNEGYIGGTAKLKGSGNSLRQMLASSDGNIGVGMEGGQLSNLLIELIGLDIAESLGFFLAGDKAVPVHCVIGDFRVKDGTMTSNAIIIDTVDTNIKGKGQINLETEKMDIELRPRPKDGSILSLKSPIFINGTLKNPGVSIGTKELLLRGGAAAVASVVLTPFVGALAFIEPGLGKDSNCAQLIQQMNKDVGETKATNNIPKNKSKVKAKAD